MESGSGFITVGYSVKTREMKEFVANGLVSWVKDNGEMLLFSDPTKKGDRYGAAPTREVKIAAAKIACEKSVIVVSCDELIRDDTADDLLAVWKEAIRMNVSRVAEEVMRNVERIEEAMIIGDQLDRVGASLGIKTRNERRQWESGVDTDIRNVRSSVNQVSERVDRAMEFLQKDREDIESLELRVPSGVLGDLSRRVEELENLVIKLLTGDDVAVMYELIEQFKAKKAAAEALVSEVDPFEPPESRGDAEEESDE